MLFYGTNPSRVPLARFRSLRSTFFYSQPLTRPGRTFDHCTITTTCCCSICQLLLYPCLQELEVALEDERRSGDDLRGQLTTWDRKRLALQTELEDVRVLLESVSIYTLFFTTQRSLGFTILLTQQFII